MPEIFRGDGGDDRVVAELTLEYELYGFGGNDYLIGGPLNDKIFGGHGKDQLGGLGGDDTISGGRDDDVISGGDGNDYLYGDEGNDTIVGNDGYDGLWGGEGRDYLDGGKGTDVIHGGDDNDTIIGGADADFLFGDQGNDRFLVSSLDGNDFVWGGEDRDTLDFLGDANGIRVDVEDGFATSIGGDPDWHLGFVEIEGIIGTNFDDVIETDDSNFDVSGEGGNDEITGGAGRNSFSGGEGDDTLDGGAGDDFMFGEEGNDELIGGAGDDFLWGGFDTNLVFGGADDDTLIMSGDGSELDGGTGSDTFVEGSMGNGPSFFGYDLFVDVDEGIAVASGPAGEVTNVLSGIEHVLTFEGDDRLIGDSQHNVLDGGGGANVIEGRGGDDALRSFGGTMLGGVGDDTLVGVFRSENLVMTGGADADHFIFEGGSSAVLDRGDITDFNRTAGDMIGAYDGLGNLVAYGAGNAFTGGGVASLRVAGHGPSDRSVDVQVDADGDGVMDYYFDVQIVDSLGSLSAADFI